MSSILDQDPVSLLYPNSVLSIYQTFKKFKKMFNIFTLFNDFLLI
jgi:hypothetical protein